MSASESIKKLTLVIPAVHPEHVSRPLPEGVMFCSPGLRETMREPFYVSPQLPLNTFEARGQLHELLQFGLSFRSARELSGVALAEQASEKKDPNKNRDEFADLDAFAETGEFVPEKKEAQPAEIDEKLIAAQKILLLAWDMEARVAELSSLQEKFDAASTNLGKIIGISDEDDFEELPGIDSKAELKGDVEADLGVPWQAVATAILTFAPQDARFITAKKEVCDLLAEIGEDITPDAVTEDEYGFALPNLEGWRLFAVKAYALLGHTRAPEGKTYLNRTLEIFAAV